MFSLLPLLLSCTSSQETFSSSDSAPLGDVFSSDLLRYLSSFIFVRGSRICRLPGGPTSYPLSLPIAIRRASYSSRQSSHLDK
jgi:hypothetical protein